MKYEIIEKNKHYLVINKPAGLLSHGLEHSDEESLADFLITDFPEIKNVGEDPMRPGIVHRLDKLVSGLMLVTRTQEGFDFFKKGFQEKRIKKTG